jgi:hypothetical protein
MILTLGAGGIWTATFSATPSDVEAVIQDPSGTDIVLDVETTADPNVFTVTYTPEVVGRWVLTVKCFGERQGAAESIVDVVTRRR